MILGSSTRHRVAALGAALAVAFGGATLPARAGVTCPEVTPAPLGFADKLYIDRARAGGEPVSVVAQDGSILVSAHAGTTHIYKDREAVPGAGDFAVGYTNQTLHWRSTDGGATWTYTGLAGLPAGPHTATSTGFSDPDLTIDRGGRIYDTEIDLANIAVFSSVDDGQSYTFGNPMVAPGDRPWLAGRAPDEVFLTFNGFVGRPLMRSTDGGIVWEILNEDIPVNGKILTDPLDPERGLIGPVDTAIGFTHDDGKTWEVTDPAPLGPSTQFFGTLGVDAAGWVYAAAAGGYRGSSDRTPDGVVSFAAYDRVEGRWTESVVLPTPPGDALWPWIVAGDDGRAAVVWYQTLENDPDPTAENDRFYIFAAYTTNAHGTDVVCSDGSTKHAPPQFSVVNASKVPVHVGGICLNGTLCNAFTGARGDRRLGDFLTVNFDADGAIFIVSGDTMLPHPLDGPKPVANPIFLKQTTGDRLLVQPRERRPTRCLYPLPAC